MNLAAAGRSAVLPRQQRLLRRAPPAPPRFVVVLDAAHGGDDTGGHLDERPAGKNRHPRPQRPPALAARRARHPGGHHPRIRRHRRSRPARRDRQPRQCAGVPQPARHRERAPAFTSSSPRWRPPQPRASSPGRPPRPRGSRAAWPWPESLNSALMHAGMHRHPRPHRAAGVDSMTCPAVAVEIAPQRDAGPAKSRPSPTIPTTRPAWPQLSPPPCSNGAPRTAEARQP